MNKATVLFLILAGLIAFVNAADIAVKVGAGGKNVFDPDTIMAAKGDNIVFTWESGKHSVIQSDAKAACAKSTAVKEPFVFPPTDVAGTTKTVAITQDTGKMWFYCGVAQHCQGGMYGTILIGQTADNGTDTGKGKDATDAGKEPAGTGTGASPSSPPDAASSPSSTGKTTSSAVSTYNSAYVVTVGVILSSMCMAAYML